MSLKAFHIFFIVIAILFLAGFGTWEVQDFLASRSGSTLAFGIGSWMGGVALVPYLLWMIRKLKNVGYL